MGKKGKPESTGIGIIKGASSSSGKDKDKGDKGPSVGIGKGKGSLGTGKGKDEQEPSGTGKDKGKRDQPSSTGKDKDKGKRDPPSGSSMTAQQWADNAILEYLHEVGGDADFVVTPITETVLNQAEAVRREMEAAGTDLDTEEGRDAAWRALYRVMYSEDPPSSED